MKSKKLILSLTALCLMTQPIVISSLPHEATAASKSSVKNSISTYTIYLDGKKTNKKAIVSKGNLYVPVAGVITYAAAQSGYSAETKYGVLTIYGTSGQEIAFTKCTTFKGYGDYYIPAKFLEKIVYKATLNQKQKRVNVMLAEDRD